MAHRRRRRGLMLSASSGQPDASHRSAIPRMLSRRRSDRASANSLIDSHCHLTDPRLFEQLDAVLHRAAAAGVTRMITIGTNPEDDAAAIALCKGRSNIRCAIGVHPNYCHEVGEADFIEKLRQLQTDGSVVALGEIGLDYHYDSADRARQRRFFEAQLQLAAELNRPVVIHCREAVDDCLAIMRGSLPQVRAV